LTKVKAEKGDFSKRNNGLDAKAKKCCEKFIQ